MPLSAEQRRTRDRVEGLIRLAAPGLNLLLAFGDRLSRLVEPEDSEYYPVRAGLGDGDEPEAARGATAEAPPTPVSGPSE